MFVIVVVNLQLDSVVLDFHIDIKALIETFIRAGPFDWLRNLNGITMSYHVYYYPLRGGEDQNSRLIISVPLPTKAPAPIPEVREITITPANAKDFIG